MKLKISFPGKLLPFGKEKHIVHDTPSESSSPGNKEPSPNAGLFIVGGIILVMLMMLLFWPPGIHAQDKSTAGLKIGERVPDITINNIVNYKGPDGEPATSAKLSDFKGKLLIIDFWATWCSPCVAMLPKMDSLQKVFGGKVQFLPVAYQTQKEVASFFNTMETQQHKKYDLPDVVADVTLNKLFPHRTLPHYVWIDRRGMVQAITEFSDVNSANIGRMLANESLDLKVKAETSMAYDKSQALFVSKPTATSVLFQSTFTRYIDGIDGGLIIKTDSLTGDRRLTAHNETILRLYRAAYREHGTYNLNNVRVEVRQPGLITNTEKRHGAEFREWAKTNAYCYELICPKFLTNRMFAIMQHDLGQFFPQYKAVIEKQMVLSLVLERTGTGSLTTTGAKSNLEFGPFGFKLINQQLGYLTQYLGSMYSSKYKMPVVDQTGYTSGVDMTVSADMTDIVALNRALEPYGLHFTEKQIETEMLVIKDQLP